MSRKIAKNLSSGSWNYNSASAPPTLVREGLPASFAFQTLPRRARPAGRRLWASLPQQLEGRG